MSQIVLSWALSLFWVGLLCVTIITRGAALRRVTYERVVVVICSVFGALVFVGVSFVLVWTPVATLINHYFGLQMLVLQDFL